MSKGTIAYVTIKGCLVGLVPPTIFVTNEVWAERDSAEEPSKLILNEIRRGVRWHAADVSGESKAKVNGRCRRRIFDLSASYCCATREQVW
jgi:hypothetical protein